MLRPVWNWILRVPLDLFSFLRKFRFEEYPCDVLDLGDQTFCRIFLSGGDFKFYINRSRRGNRFFARKKELKKLAQEVRRRGF